MTDFLARTGHSLDMGTLSFSAVAGDLSDTHAILGIGTIQQLRALLSSEAPPANSVVDWDPASGSLRIDLAENVIDQVGPGNWIYQVSIVRSSGRKLFGVSGGFQVVHSLPTEVTA